MDLQNFVDDNTIVVTCNNLTSLCQKLEKKSESAIVWFKTNGIIANPDKFQVIRLTKDATDVTHNLRIYDFEIEATISVKLLEVETDYQFNENRFTLYIEVVMQLSAVYRLQRYMSKT